MKTKPSTGRSGTTRATLVSALAAACVMGVHTASGQTPEPPPTPVVETPEVPTPVTETPEVPEVGVLDTIEPSRAAERLSTTFEPLAGSEENARSLVTGLREGNEITLTTTVDGEVTTRTFQPAVSGQGYGNVHLSLALAEEQLRQAGITTPTASQLEAALNGGSITVGTGAEAQTMELPGVLALRAEGQGWGQIARQLDVRLGDVASGARRNPRAAERAAERAGERAGRDAAEALEPTGRPERLDRGQRPERADRPERPERPERLDRPARPERPVRPERAERPERPVRPERPERGGRP